jgi:hypothetical protein
MSHNGQCLRITAGDELQKSELHICLGGSLVADKFMRLRATTDNFFLVNVQTVPCMYE